MSTKLPLALALFLSASILAAAELRTGVPYYMAPHIWALGGGVAPATVGNQECPGAVRLTPEVSRGVPIIFSAKHSLGKSVVIDENTEVSIRFNFNASVDKCPLNPRFWGNRFLVPTPKTLPILLLGDAVFFIYEGIQFKIKEEGPFYRVYTQKHGEEGLAEYDLVNYHDKANDVWRLAITSEGSTLRFNFHEAKDYHRMIESVV